MIVVVVIATGLSIAPKFNHRHHIVEVRFGVIQ
jgi:hypothetical protein